MNKVKVLRAVHGWTLNDLAERAHLSVVTIRNLEAEVRPYMASKHVVQVVALAFGIPAAELAYLMLPQEWVSPEMAKLGEDLLQKTQEVV